MRIIRATTEDVPRIMECAQEFCSVIPGQPLNQDHYQTEWQRFLGDGVGMISLLEDDDGKVVGGIGGVAYPDLLSGLMCGVELFWYVKPDFRSGLWPVRLLGEFESWARLKGCSWCAMVHMECSMPERLKEFYRRRGYELFETQYRKELV